MKPLMTHSNLPSQTSVLGIASLGVLFSAAYIHISGQKKHVSLHVKVQGKILRVNQSTAKLEELANYLILFS